MPFHRVSSTEAEQRIAALGETSTEAEQRIAALGETFTQTEESFAAFEAKFLVAYGVIFGAMAEAATVKESGRSGAAELSMSKWVEPSRAIGVVVRDKAALKPELIAAAQAGLAQLEEKFAVVVDDYPTVVYVLSGGDLLVSAESVPEDLRALGLVT